MGSEMCIRDSMNAIEDCEAQLRAVGEYFDGLADLMDRIPQHQAAEELSGEEEAACAAD